MYSIHSRPRSCALAWLLPLLLSVGQAAAGPVSGAAAEVESGSIEAAPAVLLDPSAPGLIDNALPHAGAEPAASGSAGTTSAISAQAAEIIREAQAGAHAADALHPAQGTRQSAAPTTRSRSAAREGGDEGSMREMGKAALDWFKQAVPWLRDEPDDDSDDGRRGVDSVEWAESPLDGGNAGARGHAGAAVMNAGAATPQGPGHASGYGSDASGQGYGMQRNYVRDAVDLLRMVIEHPMTWLIVALFVIGGFAISKFDRRPK